MRWKVGVSGSRAIMRSLARAGEDATIEDILSLFGEFYEGDFCPAGCIPLVRHPGYYRCRLVGGNYRMVYRVSPKQRSIYVTRIRPRATAYEGLE